MKRNNAIIVSLMTFLLAFPVSSLAADHTYTDYNLPMLKGNTSTSHHEKITDDLFVNNIVTSLTKTTHANFWVVDLNGNSISPKFTMSQDQETKLRFTSNKKKGDKVQMRMENNEASVSTAYVTGKVNFK